MSVAELVELARKYEVDAVHPGYGFLSESSDMDRQMSKAGIMVVGPGAEVLDRTGDKLQARLLAEECNVPVLPAFTPPTGDVEEVRKFASQNGLPIMIKAVDGGGGRGIRLVRKMEDLKSLVTRAIEESPSKQVFAEKAAVDGFRHIEVQIIGDGRGNVMHLWERECSIQRRYQKIVELAPSMTIDRSKVAPLIESAVAMAKRVSDRLVGPMLSLLTVIGELPLPGHFRIPLQPPNFRVRLPGNQPTATSGTYRHRVDMFHRYRQGSAPTRTRRHFRRGRTVRPVSRSHHTTQSVFNTASNHSREPRERPLAQHWQDTVVSVPFW